MKKTTSIPGPARASHPVLAAIAFSALAALGQGCGSSGGTGANQNDAAQDQATAQDTGSGTCAPSLDLPAAAPTCTTLVNMAQPVPFTPLTGSAPTPAGGTIRDGLYVSTRTGSYGATTGGGRRITFAVTDSATRMFWSGEVLDAAGATVTTSFRADTTISVTGTRINFTSNCVSTQPSPIPPALDFTVSGQDVLLSLANGSAVAETKYTRIGCPP